MPQTPPAYQAASYAALSINPEYFKEDFSVDAFLVTLTKDVIDAPAAKQTDGRTLSDEAAAKATIERVQLLQKRFARAEDEIALLSHEVAAQLLELQHGTSQDEQNYKVGVAVGCGVCRQAQGCGVQPTESAVLCATHIPHTNKAFDESSSHSC